MAKRVSNKVWGVIFQEENAVLLNRIGIERPDSLALFESPGEAERYRSKLIKMSPKFNKNYKVVSCILSYVEPTPKKHGLSI